MQWRRVVSAANADWAQLLAHDVGGDAIALVAITGALLLEEYLTGAIIALMLAGGNALEDYAQGRATRELRRIVRRAVCEPDDREAGDTALEVRLDLDRARLEPDERVRDGTREHVATVGSTMERVRHRRRPEVRPMSRLRPAPGLAGHGIVADDDRVGDLDDLVDGQSGPLGVLADLLDARRLVDARGAETTALLGGPDPSLFALDEAGLKAKLAGWIPDKDFDRVLAGSSRLIPGGGRLNLTLRRAR